MLQGVSWCSRRTQNTSDGPRTGSVTRGPVKELDHLDGERGLLHDVVDELDRGALVQPVLDAKDPDPDAVIDRGELVVLLARTLQRIHELHVDSARGSPVAASHSASTGRRGACSAGSSGGGSRFPLPGENPMCTRCPSVLERAPWKHNQREPLLTGPIPLVSSGCSIGSSPKRDTRAKTDGLLLCHTAVLPYVA